MDLNDISPELRKKAKECTSPDELIALAKEEGYKLSDQDLQAVSGGSWDSCGSDGGCSEIKLGDARTCISPERVRASFVNGAVDGGELD